MTVTLSGSAGFIGLGALGEPMALNLVKAGTPRVVWNRSPSKCASLAGVGAAVAPNVAEVFARCQVVFLMLADSAAMDAGRLRGSLRLRTATAWALRSTTGFAPQAKM